MKQSRFKSLFWPHWLDCFWSCCHRSGRFTETVNILYQFLWRYVIFPTKTHLTYNNNKPWFTAKLRQLRQAKEDAYRKGDKVLYKQAKYTLEKEIRVAKRNYSGKLRNKFSSSDSASVWKGMEDITSYKTPPPALWRINNWQTIWMSSISGLKKHHSHLLQPPSPPHPHCW